MQGPRRQILVVLGLTAMLAMGSLTVLADAPTKPLAEPVWASSELRAAEILPAIQLALRETLARAVAWIPRVPVRDADSSATSRIVEAHVGSNMEAEADPFGDD